MSISRNLLPIIMITASTSAYAAPIDLTTWQQEGNAANGNWSVAGDGSNVFQSINGEPTFFVSPEEFINTEFNGSFGVETSSDNDYIGFVFGYQSPLASNGDAIDDYSFFLFDWRQSDQNISLGLAEEGFNLSHVSGSVADFSPFWAHDLATSPDVDFDVVATDTGPGRGWADNVPYEFDLDYQANQIIISITGGIDAFATTQEIFNISPSDVPGITEFQSGRFGFYNYSQSGVRYAGFTEEAADPSLVAVSEPGTLGLLALALLGSAFVRRRYCQAQGREGS